MGSIKIYLIWINNKLSDVLTSILGLDKMKFYPNKDFLPFVQKVKVFLTIRWLYSKITNKWACCPWLNPRRTYLYQNERRLTSHIAAHYKPAVENSPKPHLELLAQVLLSQVYFCACLGTQWSSHVENKQHRLQYWNEHCLRWQHH